MALFGFPAGCGSFLRYGLAFGWRQLIGSRLATLRSAELAECNGCWILASVGVFEWRPVHLLADGLLYHTAGVDEEIVIFA